MSPLRHLGAYGSVALLCAAANVAILVAADALGMHYWLGSLVSFACCVLLGYALHARFTFAAASHAAGLARYAAAMALNLPAFLVAIHVFYRLLALPMPVAAPVATVAMTAANYLLSRWAIRGKVS